jgi:hypothetical protein
MVAVGCFLAIAIAAQTDAPAANQKQLEAAPVATPVVDSRHTEDLLAPVLPVLNQLVAASQSLTPTEKEPPPGLPPTIPPQAQATCSVTAGCPVGPTQNYGTRVTFLGSPNDAARQAEAAHKLVFVLHISGNFEDRQFT